jgi:tetratricopeptide (TPR) repeat protein
VASRYTAAGVALGAALLVAGFAGRASAAWTPTSPDGCPARPADPVAARALAGEMFTRGAERAAAGDDQEAVVLYSCSYSIAPHPNALYNLALAQEAAGQLADACIVLELYLRQAPEAINRPDAEELLAELRSLVTESGDTPTDTPPPALPPLPSEDVVAAEGATDEGGVSDTGLAGWILLGAGVALAAGGGTAFAVLAAQEKSLVLDPVPGTPWSDIAPHQDTYDLYSGLEIGFFAVGGAAVAVGAALLLVDLGTESESPPVLIAMPLIGPGMVGLSWSGSFDAF